MTAQQGMLNKAKRYHANQLEDAAYNKQLRIDAKGAPNFNWLKYFKEQAIAVLG